VGDLDADVADAAVECLARSGEGAARLAPLLRDPAAPTTRRKLVLRVLREEGSIAGLEGTLRELARSESTPVELRAVATALLAIHGAPPDGAATRLAAFVSGEPDLTDEDAAHDGLARLGAEAARALRPLLADSTTAPYRFHRLVPLLARVDPSGRELALLFDEVAGDRDDERAELVDWLGRLAPSGLVDFFLERWDRSGPSVRISTLRIRFDPPAAAAAACERGFVDASPEVRRAAFELALRTPEVATDRCIAAVTGEREATLRSAFLELLPRSRGEPAVRRLLLEELVHDTPGEIESVAAGMDVFRGDAEVVAALAAAHDRAYARQLAADPQDRDSLRRLRKIVLRTVGRVGGARAADFLRTRARAERAVDADLGAEAVRALAAAEEGDEPLLVDLLQPPSLPGVRAEAAITCARRGDERGVSALVPLLPGLGGDARRRAFDALAEGRSSRLFECVKIFAVDAEGRLSDEQRADAISDLARLEEPEALAALETIATRDRSVESRIEATRALGRRGGEDAARILEGLGEAAAAAPPSEAIDQIRLAVARSLAATRSERAAGPLLAQLLERPLRRAASTLPEPGARRSPLERSRLYDREDEAAALLARLPGSVPLASSFAALRERGLLALPEGSFLLRVGERISETHPAAAAALARAAIAISPDPPSRFRASLLLAASSADRLAAATWLEAASALARTNEVEPALGAALGSLEPRSGRVPRAALAAAASLARASAAYAAGDAGTGRRHVDAAIRRATDDARTLLDASVLLAAHGDGARACELARTARALAPLDAGVADACGSALLACGDPAGAKEAQDAATRLEGSAGTAR
ncbi:MAG TPA: hypothetical protein VKE69_01415, partial [Planctomycetota bacterium]|nr:hypothetical protein [Planctomycetota bacterium]